MTNDFIGQWKGESKSGAFVLINFDQNDNNVTGRVSLYESFTINGISTPYYAWSFVEGSVNSEGLIEGSVNSPSIHSRSGELLTEKEIAAVKDNGEIELPTSTNFRGIKIGDLALDIEWTSIYPSGKISSNQVIVERDHLGRSKVKHDEMSWDDFKAFALKQKDGLIYRGQAQGWRLQTSFHRTGHADLIAYLDEKIPEVEHHINAYSEHVYDMKNDRSLGALLNLAQHHGYPTPLLDWTKSPYVASFFAFQDKASLKEDGSISIFIFDEPAWAKKTGRVAQLRVPNLIVRTIELPGYGNSRVIPQQAMTMYSNADDIEYIIQWNEKKNKNNYLRAVSIPASEREVAMRELSLMGITWGSIFPGLDGVCKQLNSRHFKNL